MQCKGCSSQLHRLPERHCLPLDKVLARRKILSKPTVNNKSTLGKQKAVMAEGKSTAVSSLPLQDITKTNEPEPVAHGLESDPPATKRELYSYYAYYAGNNGIGSFQ